MIFDLLTYFVLYLMLILKYEIENGPDTRIKPSVESPKSGILVTEVITFDKIARWVILGRS